MAEQSAEVFERAVYEQLEMAGLRYRPQVSIGGTQLDAVIYPIQDADDFIVGVEVTFTRSHGSIRAVERAVGQLIALRSQSVLQGGIVVTNLYDPHSELVAMYGESSFPIRVFTLDSLRQEARSGAFQAFWNRVFQGKSPKSETEVAPAAPGDRSLFACMEYNDHFDDVFDYGIAPVAKRRKFTAYRLKDHPSFGTMISDLQDDLKNATCVVCDVSTTNPNVLYEVGYSHALAKPTILIGAVNTDMPFNTKSYRHLLYRNISNLEQLLERELETMEARGQF